MNRVVSALAATVTAAVLVPAVASASDVQIGVTASPLVSPTCPTGTSGNSCTIVLTQVTAYATKRDGVTNPTTIKQSGVIASFSVGLAGSPTVPASLIPSVNAKYGGPPEVQLTVLRPVGTTAVPSYRVAAQSVVFNVTGELGRVAEIPLVSPMPVVRGEILALTVPTWAPVLSFQLSTTSFSYAQSRKRTISTTVSKGKTTNVNSCDAPASANLAQATIGEFSNYTCGYPGTRVEYSALEITTPSGLSSSARRRAAQRRKAA